MLLPSSTGSQQSITINTYTDASGSKTLIGSVSGVPGLNFATVDGIMAGSQVVEVVDGSGNVLVRASSTVDVVGEIDESVGGVCNWNYAVVSFA